MTKETLSVLSEKVREEEDPEVLLSEIFKFINLEPAMIAIYFKLLHSEKAMTVTDLKGALTYSERTIRKYLKDMLDTGYIKRTTIEEERPCYAYFAVSPKKVWQKLVSEVRKVRKRATKAFGKYNG
ncbi:MAG: hypothetical protein ABIG20_04495 [archaeon]